jgi:hypothetical protein
LGGEFSSFFGVEIFPNLYSTFAFYRANGTKKPDQIEIKGFPVSSPVNILGIFKDQISYLERLFLREGKKGKNFILEAELSL